MDKPEPEEVAGLVLKEAYLSRTVGIWYFWKNRENVATGNLFMNDDEYFILTCRHVADALFDAAKFELKLFDGTVIRSGELAYSFSTNVDLDLAVLHVTTNIECTDYYGDSDFLRIEDFSNHDFSLTNLFLTGFPSDLVTPIKDVRELVPYSYMTHLYDRISPKENHIYCDYPLRAGQIEMSRSNTSVPEPFGLSGSLLLAVPHLTPDIEIWHAGLVKVIGMQCRAVPDTHLVCSNTKHLLDYFKSE